MTDTEVLQEVASARKAYKAAQTRRSRKVREVETKAFQRYGSTDVEQSARENAIRRTEQAADSAFQKACDAYNLKLEGIKKRAGVWADLVPSATRCKR